MSAPPRDARTSIKTEASQHEDSTTSERNAIVFNHADERIAFERTTETVTQMQEAHLTEITRRYTPTQEELDEMLQLMTVHAAKEGKEGEAAAIVKITQTQTTQTKGCNTTSRLEQQRFKSTQE